MKRHIRMKSVHRKLLEQNVAYEHKFHLLTQATASLCLCLCTIRLRRRRHKPRPWRGPGLGRDEDEGSAFTRGRSCPNLASPWRPSLSGRFMSSTSSSCAREGSVPRLGFGRRRSGSGQREVGGTLAAASPTATWTPAPSTRISD